MAYRLQSCGILSQYQFSSSFQSIALCPGWPCKGESWCCCSRNSFSFLSFGTYILLFIYNLVLLSLLWSVRSLIASLMPCLVILAGSFRRPVRFAAMMLLRTLLFWYALSSRSSNEFLILDPAILVLKESCFKFYCTFKC